MNQHTPGPWAWYETDSGVCRVVGGIVRNLVIAECSVRDPGCEEQRANAALIASLPELLEQLNQLQQENARLTQELSTWRAEQINVQLLLNSALSELARLRSFAVAADAEPQPPTPAIGKFLEGYGPKTPG